ncbi:MAG: hypothetical protein AVDCRST_MAG93-3516 [uncultured Chloroflexia bacterium]|uniref:Uncharacterized protein n=1 Tax=uncultured Chloroflexia bacterium TaxID=1672391 RepID=A0A6J4JS48_9CHLR|nr:MAG: hypothetical protein AVDCRST_MAG93-3516 [uncultured Chloroflexia bacterium]
MGEGSRAEAARELGAFAPGRAGILVVTLTAPGVDRLPFAPERCRQRGAHKCGGRKGCRVARDHADHWNATLSSRFRKANDQARKRTSRLFRQQTPLLCRVFELQERGVFHVHLALAFASPRQRAEARAYVGALRETSLGQDFGLSLNVSPPRTGQEVADYLSKGLNKTVAHPLVPSQPVFVSTVLSQATGCTIRSILRRRLVAFVNSATLRFLVRVRALELGFVPLVRLIEASTTYRGAFP